MRDDGIRYEEYCCKYLQEKGYSTRTTVASGDQGADIIAEKDGIRIAVQCKYRTEGAVGNDAIQQALAGKMYYDCDLALVITNVDFTAKAISAAQKLKVKMWPRVEMIEELDDEDIEDEPDEEVENLFDNVYETVSSLIKGSASTLSFLYDRTAWGKQLIKQRFRIPFAFDDENNNSSDTKLKKIEEDYLEGLSSAKRLLKIINENSNYEFYIVDWSYSKNQDKNIYVYETSEILNVYFPSEIQKILREAISPDLSVECPTRHSVIVSCFDCNENKSDNIIELIRFIKECVVNRISRSLISLGTSDELIECEESYGVTARDADDQIITDEFESFYVFTCKEVLDEVFVSEIDDEAKLFFRRKLLIKKYDDHRFILAIRKQKGLNNHLSLVDVHNFRGRNYSKLISVTTGMINDYLVFTINLKNIDIAQFDNLLNEKESRATVEAYVEQICYYLMGFVDLIVINKVKDNKIEMSLHKTRSYSKNSGGKMCVHAKGIRIKFTDINYKTILTTTEDSFSTLDKHCSFPILFLPYEDFIGRKGCFDNIGINTMMIQKLLHDFPSINNILENYYLNDHLSKGIDEYLSVWDSMYEMFVKAYAKLVLCQVYDPCVMANFKGDQIQGYSYNIPTNELDTYYSDEYDYSRSIKENYYFWKLINGVKLRNAVYELPCTSSYYLDSDFTIDCIEKALKSYNIRFEALRNHSHGFGYFYYKIHGNYNLGAVLSKINELAESDDTSGHMYGFKREFGVSVFIWSEYPFGREWYTRLHLPILRLNKEIQDETLISKLLIDESIRLHSRVNSYYDKHTKCGLIAVKFNKITIRNLEIIFSENPTGDNQLWGYWNDLILSLVSLLYLYNCHTNNMEENYTNIEIRLYDSNKILIAALTGDGMLYSYLHDDESLNIAFLDFYDTRLLKEVEAYKDDIVPMINKTLLQAIEKLEEISKEDV